MSLQSVNISRLAGSPKYKPFSQEASPPVGGSDHQAELGSTIGHFRKMREQRLSVLSLTSQARDAANDIDKQILKLKLDFQIRLERFTNEVKTTEAQRLYRKTIAVLRAYVRLRLREKHDEKLA